MALKKPQSAPATTNASFEDEPSTGTDTAVAEKPVQEPQAPAAAVEATTAIAKASANAVSSEAAAALAKNFKKEVEEMRGAADFGYGAHRVFKAKDGVIREGAGEKLVLGKWVKVRLLAWDNHFEISPGEDSKSAGNYVAYSKDGVTIDNVIGDEVKSWEGKAVADYVDFLQKEEEFPKAGKREFIDCQVAAMGSEEEPDFTGVIQVSLSSSSIPAFRKYQSDLEATARCVALGLPGYKLPEDPFTFFFIREAAEKGNKTWTKLKICSVLPAKI